MKTTSVTWARLRTFVKRRDKMTCYHCGGIDENGHCDHLLPLSKGGTDAISNLVWSCERCNLKKGSKVLEDNPPVSSSQLEDDDLIYLIPRVKPPLPKKDYRNLSVNLPDFSHIAREFFVLLISWIVPPYPRQKGYAYKELQWEDIIRMRRGKVTTWIRERIWPIDLEIRYGLDYAMGWEATNRELIAEGKSPLVLGDEAEQVLLD